jgi:hypothetical protein
MHSLVEVIACLTVAADDVLGDMSTQEFACLVQERLIVAGQLNP